MRLHANRLHRFTREMSAKKAVFFARWLLLFGIFGTSSLAQAKTSMSNEELH